MIYVLKTELPKNKSVLIALSSVYGIGRSRSLLICKKLGFLATLKVKDISDEQVSDLSHLVENFALVIAIANDLKKVLKQNQINLASINSYRGNRLKKGLPVRGQRTHSNAQTAARFVNRSQEQQNYIKKKNKKTHKKK